MNVLGQTYCMSESGFLRHKGWMQIAMCKPSSIVLGAILHLAAANAAVALAPREDPSQPGNAFWVPMVLPPAKMASNPQVSVSAVPIPVGSPVLSPSWQLQAPNPNGSFDTPLQYPIPGTEKRVDFTSINAPLASTAVLMVLLQAGGAILNQTIQLGQDGFVDGGRFIAQIVNGTTSYVELNVEDKISTGQKVTYGTLDIVLRGLAQFMVMQDNFFETAFNIYDGKWGQVGSGTIIGGVPAATS